MSLFRKEALEHQKDAALGDVILFHPKAFSYLTFGLFFLVLLMLLLLGFGNYERRAVVSGYLVPTNGLIKVYAKGDGVISDVHVEEGQLVNVGDRLLTVSTVRTSNEVRDIDAALLAELKDSETSLKRKLDAQSDLNQSETKRLASVIGGLKREISQLKEHLVTTQKQFQAAKKRTGEYKTLLKKGTLSTNQYQDQENTLLDSKLNMQAIKKELIAQENKLIDAEHQQSQLPFTQISILSDLKQSISEVKQKYIRIEGQRSYTVVAPSEGRITALQADVGRNTSQKMLLAILPENAQFEADLFVPTHSIGFIKNKQKVNIRYSAFPYQRFGVYEGEVFNITNIILSPDELTGPIRLNEPVYRVTVKLNTQTVKAYGNELALQAGMTLEADIVLDRLSLIESLLDPLFRMTGRL